ncbi:MAG TPA: hypothetical protein VJR30_07185 [Bradyrhizobium sp.]|nr:hypothetical protein [Bradyrhizobium sp.]
MSETLTETMTGRLPSDAPGALVELNKRALHFMFDAQRVILGEMVTASDEILEDVRAEMHMAADFAARINEAHSVDNIRTVLKECGQHQMDVFSRGSQNFVRRNQRLVEATSQLLTNARKQ